MSAPVIRTVERANEILREEGCTWCIGLDDEERLGCTVAEHERYPTTEAEGALRDWARSCVDPVTVEHDAR